MRRWSTMGNTSNKFSPEVRSRAVRLVLDLEHEHSSRWAAITSVASKIGCTAQTVSEWIKRTEIDAGKPAGLPIAPSTDHDHRAKRADPAKLSARAKLDMALKPEIARVLAENFEVLAHARSGSRWGAKASRWRAARSNASWPLWDRTAQPRQAGQDDCAGQGRTMPARLCGPSLPCPGAEPALAVGLHLRLDLVGLRRRGLRHRRLRLRPPHRRLARLPNHARGLRAGRSRAGPARAPSRQHGGAGASLGPRRAVWSQPVVATLC